MAGRRHRRRLPAHSKLELCRKVASSLTLEFGHFPSDIPKGFRPKAQGCDIGATLGNHRPTSQPQGGCVSRMSFSAIRLGVCAEAPGLNPVGVVRLFGHFTQGSSRFAGQPWALLRNPVGIQSRMHCRTCLVHPPLSKMSKLQSLSSGERAGVRGNGATFASTPEVSPHSRLLQPRSPVPAAG